MSVNDRKRKGESRKKGYAKRAALGNEKRNKAMRIVKQVRAFPHDKQAADLLALKLRAGTLPAFITAKADAVLAISVAARSK